jgi:hypothetical protein
MEQGKEPSQRSFELTAHEWVRQEGIAHSPRFAGDFGWRFHRRVMRPISDDWSLSKFVAPRL